MFYRRASLRLGVCLDVQYSLQIYQINRCCALLMWISLFGHQIQPLFLPAASFSPLPAISAGIFPGRGLRRLLQCNNVHFGIIVIHCSRRQRLNLQHFASYQLQFSCLQTAFLRAHIHNDIRDSAQN